jgi:hypothetical protein
VIPHHAVFLRSKFLSEKINYFFRNELEMKNQQNERLRQDRPSLLKAKPRKPKPDGLDFRGIR